VVLESVTGVNLLSFVCIIILTSLSSVRDLFDGLSCGHRRRLDSFLLSCNTTLQFSQDLGSFVRVFSRGNLLDFGESDLAAAVRAGSRFLVSLSKQEPRTLATYNNQNRCYMRHSPKVFSTFQLNNA
jgi:hypothetical protein